MSKANISNDKFYLYFPWFLLVFVSLVFPAKAILKPEMIAPLSLIHHIHALSMGAWFLLLAIQPTLISKGNHQLHRKLGWASLAVVALWFSVSLQIQIMNWERTGAQLVLVANLINLPFFLILYGLAIAYRKSTEVHKRLMIFATLTIMGPAVGRVGEVLGIEPEKMAPVFLVLFLSPLINDLFMRRRVHPATIVGIVFCLSTIPVILIYGSDPEVYQLLVSVFGEGGSH